jgi:hypothetical protein
MKFDLDKFLRDLPWKLAWTLAIFLLCNWLTGGN